MMAYISKSLENRPYVTVSDDHVQNPNDNHSEHALILSNDNEIKPRRRSHSIIYNTNKK